MRVQCQIWLRPTDVLQNHSNNNYGPKLLSEHEGEICAVQFHSIITLKHALFPLKNKYTPQLYTFTHLTHAYTSQDDNTQGFADTYSKLDVPAENINKSLT